MTPRQPSVPRGKLKASRRVRPRESGEPLVRQSLAVEKLGGAREPESAAGEPVEEQRDARGHGILPVAAEVEQDDSAVLRAFDEGRHDAVGAPVGPGLLIGDPVESVQAGASARPADVPVARLGRPEADLLVLLAERRAPDRRHRPAGRLVVDPRRLGELALEEGAIDAPTCRLPAVLRVRRQVRVRVGMVPHLVSVRGDATGDRRDNGG